MKFLCFGGTLKYLLNKMTELMQLFGAIYIVKGKYMKLLFSGS